MSDEIDDPMAPDTTESALDGIDAIPSMSGGESDSSPAPTPAPTPSSEPAAKPAPEPAPSSDEDDFGLGKLKPAEKPAAAKAAEKPAEKPAVADKAKPDAGGVKQLREQYETTKKERDELTAKLAELERAKEEGTKAQVEAATKALKDEMAAIRARAEEAESRVRFLDYRQSNEFRDKYEKPIEQTWEKIVEDLEGAEFEEDDGTTRKLTANDVLPLLRMTTFVASKEAKRIFGPVSEQIMAHRSKLLELQKGSESAIKEYREKGQKFELEKQEAKSREDAEVEEEFNANLEAAAKSYPHLFGKPSDPEQLKVFTDGERLVNLALRGQGLSKDLDPATHRKYVVRAQSQMAARARSFGVAVARANGLEAKVAELEAKLAALNASEPGQGAKTPVEAPASEPDDVFAGIDKIPGV